MPTPVRDVQLFLITPDGEPAEGVEFALRALHLETDAAALCPACAAGSTFDVRCAIHRIASFV